MAYKETLISRHLHSDRLRPTKIKGRERLEEFYSDRSRIVFCSSFRRMMQKAQVFSLEENTSVRNRLTHTLEVADIGRTIANKIGQQLIKRNLANEEDARCIQAIVENACLMHDIGNPPFGHFGEKAIQDWFAAKIGKDDSVLKESRLFDMKDFDGNPQGFRIATKLHTEIDEFSLNLTLSTLLASIKYPNFGKIDKQTLFYKKRGIYTSEKRTYEVICSSARHQVGKRYFLAYLMELADDICYCLSDIADAFEKRITDSRSFKAEFKKILKKEGLSETEINEIIPGGKITNFSHQLAIKLSHRIISEATTVFVDDIDDHLSGAAPEIVNQLAISQRILMGLKTFARQFIYTTQEVQRIEIAGYSIVHGLLNHYEKLLNVKEVDFRHFHRRNQMRRDSGLDLEWRIFKHLSGRMLKAYKFGLSTKDESELDLRCRLIVDYISGMTDQSALKFYQNISGGSLRS